jgi:hypothetical protein
VSRRKTGAGTANRTLIAAVRRELQAHADAVKAPQMQAYMKSSMPYYVDLIAGKRIGLLLKNHPREMKPLLRAWSRCGDLWKRRTDILDSRAARIQDRNRPRSPLRLHRAEHRGP